MEIETLRIKYNFEDNHDDQIIGVYSVKNTHNRDTTKMIIEHVINHPKEYYEYWNNVAYCLNIGGKFPKYQQQCLKELKGHMRCWPDSFKMGLEEWAEKAHPGENLYLDISLDELREILPSIVGRMNEDDQWDMLLCCKEGLPQLYIDSLPAGKIVELE
jgi:hypothetical protein